VIAVVGRALFVLLCVMTAPRETVPPPPTIQPKPAPPPGADRCFECRREPRQAGSWFCGDTCQATWLATTNHVIPIPIAPPTLPDGNHYRRTC
jgi:hypothetical protein